MRCAAVKQCGVTAMILNNGKKRIPIGYEDFKQVIDGGFYYVDKTMLIYELLHNGGQNNLITRPRRFGKTLNFSMLKYFFDITEKENSYLFDGLKISEHYDELAVYKNTHPVIMLSMKCAKKRSFEDAVYSLCKEIQGQFRKHRYITESDRVDAGDRSDFERLLSAEPNERLFGESIKLLSSCLCQYYGMKSIILIDEYDVPLESAYFAGYYDEMVSFVRSLFESALKTNPTLEISVITGCLRISKESIFTGLNNLRVSSILSTQYSKHFGFEEFEVKDMLQYYELSDKFEWAKKWYDGYLFGNTEIYNPWSIMNYVQDLLDNPELMPASSWVNSSSNSIIRELVGSSDEETRADVERLVNGGSVETYIRETITYGDLKNGSENIWSFLFFTGYLRVKSVRTEGTKQLYTLVIPNLEVHDCYTDVIMEYFEQYKREVDREELWRLLLSGDAEGFAERITRLLKKTISYHDNMEQFYHGLITGLLSLNPYYRAVSNRETGDGRSDLVLYQQDRFINAIILEFKVCKGSEEIDDAAERALRQIDERGYASEAAERGYRHIIKYGVAFKGKLCFAVVG